MRGYPHSARHRGVHCLQHPLLSPPPTPFAGIPDTTDKLAELGLLPFSDALEQVDASEVPGLSSAFGVSSISGGHSTRTPATACPGCSLPSACHGLLLQPAGLLVSTLACMAGWGTHCVPALSLRRLLAVPKAGPLSSKASSGSGSDSPSRPAATPPELVEVVIRKGAL